MILFEGKLYIVNKRPFSFLQPGDKGGRKNYEKQQENVIREITDLLLSAHCLLLWQGCVFFVLVCLEMKIKPVYEARL